MIIMKHFVMKIIDFQKSLFYIYCKKSWGNSPFLIWKFLWEQFPLKITINNLSQKLFECYFFDFSNYFLRETTLTKFLIVHLIFNRKRIRTVVQLINQRRRKNQRHEQKVKTVMIMIVSYLFSMSCAQPLYRLYCPKKKLALRLFYTCKLNIVLLIETRKDM